MLPLPRLMNPARTPKAVAAEVQPHRSDARGERDARVACREAITAIVKEAGLLERDFSAFVSQPIAVRLNVTQTMLDSMWRGQLEKFIETAVDAYWPKFDRAIDDAKAVAETAKRELREDEAWKELTRIIDEEVDKAIEIHTRTLRA